MSRSIRNDTSSLAFGIVGRLGGSSAGFVVAALNAASAASREEVGLRVLPSDILLPPLPFTQAALVASSISSRIDGSSFSGLFTRVEIGHMRMVSEGNGRIKWKAGPT